MSGKVSWDFQDQPLISVRQNTNYNSPVTNVNSNDIRCNTGGLESGPSTSTATVAAGSTVGFALDQSIFHPGKKDREEICLTVR
jgi:hypothetical protein